jgi:polyhydroxyalkanoate synthesis regulator protein
MEQVKMFKRYQNRKLYDVERSCYITVTEVLKLPVGSFKIFAHPTGEDVTLDVILQAFSHVEVTDKSEETKNAIHSFLLGLGTEKKQSITPVARPTEQANG